jgi:hypothetical protein
MKIFLLNAKAKSRVWTPWYDKAFGFVVRADDEKQARELASKEAGDEGAKAWLNPQQSLCEIVGDAVGNGEEAQVLLRDFAAA